MASIGYAKPHYRLITEKERDKYYSIYINYIRYGDGVYIHHIDSPNIYLVIKAIFKFLSLNVIYFNNQYWVVTYPQGQVHD